MAGHKCDRIDPLLGARQTIWGTCCMQQQAAARMRLSKDLSSFLPASPVDAGRSRHAARDSLCPPPTPASVPLRTPPWPPVPRSSVPRAPVPPVPFSHGSPSLAH